jgi:hypothetical protein
VPFTSSPVEVPGLQGVRSIIGDSSVGTFCAITSCNTIACWGANYHGVAGPGGTSVTLPQAIAGISDAISVTIGEYHACALRPSEVDCWGDNESDELGVPGAVDSSTPERAFTF